jgi:phosphate/phosphite/phosphonate ABC transporter binding protein
MEEKDQMNKKTWSTIMAVLMMLAMVLSACAPATPEPTAEPTTPPEAPSAQETEAPAAPTDPWADVDPSGQTVIFWHQHTRDRETALQDIVADFNATNEYGITVIAEYQGGYGDIFNKMLGVLNTPDAPHLVVAYQNQAATYQLVDGLVDMNSMVNSPKWGLSEEEQSDFFPGFYTQDVFPTYDNARLGWPPNRSMEVLYYNADWLAELGYDGPPTTPEEFKEMACKAVEQPFSGAVVEGSIGYELSIDASRFASFTFAFGGDIFDYNTSEFTYDSDAAVEAMTFLQGMFNEGCASIVTESFGDQTDFGTGKLLFTVGSSSGLPFYRSAVEEGGANFEWSVAAIPHTTADPVMNIYGASVSMPVSTPEAELASWLFLKYYTEPDVQALWATVSQYFPVRESVANGLTDYFASDPPYKTAFDMLQYGYYEPPVPGYDFVRVKVGEAMAAIANGDDVAGTLAALDVESNEILSEQMTSPLPTPVPTEPPEPTAAPIGTTEHPIKVLFVPSVDSQVITTGGEVMAAALKEATGLEFEVSVPTSYAATIEEMCASPTDTMGFIPGLGYVLANQLCGVDVAFKAVRFGWDVYWAEILVPAESEVQTLADLDGLKWAYPDPGSTSGYLAILPMLAEAGISAGETLEAGGHTGVVRAIYNGEADFGSAFFSPPLKPEGEPAWAIGDDPEIPADLVPSCAPNDEGSQLLCSGWRVLDARAGLREEAPDIVQKVRVLAISPEIPNDTLSFGPEFPADLREQISTALVAFAETEAWNESIGSQDFYGWTGLSDAIDEEYDVVRQMVELAGLTLEDLGQ